MDFAKLKALLLNGDPEFWPLLASLTRQARDFDVLLLRGHAVPFCELSAPDEANYFCLKILMRDIPRQHIVF
jgi:hypothetical protein